ncbi:MAG: prolipoprotein diacylglyceryl transferase [Candidatus Omnitrophota bacterium]|nr:prolipoprotein diacylglyceryl transferase [Candidatus Omnitrophota bacterium]
MHPILIKIGPVAVYSYGVMVSLGAGLAAFLIYRRAGELGFAKDRVIDLVVLLLMSGIVGARLFYVTLNLPYYATNIFEIFDLTKGGLVWYGGFLAALSALIWYTVKRRLNFWVLADLMVPYLALAQAFGRIGCFLNGCCYGIEAPRGHPLGVTFPQDSHILRYPTQLYSSLVLLLIFVLLRIWQDNRRFVGEIFLGYCILYAAKRFLMEFLRGDNRKVFAGLTIFQIISIAVLTAALSIFIYKTALWKKKISALR